MDRPDVAALLRRARDGRFTSPAEAHGLLLEAERACRATNNERDLVDVLEGLAQLERDGGHPGRAVAPYVEAVAIVRRREAPLQLAHTLRHLGDAHTEIGEVAEAGPCFDEALTLYRAHAERDALDFANALRSAALHAGVTGNRARARELWREAREHYALAGIEQGVAESDRQLARLNAQA